MVNYDDDVDNDVYDDDDDDVLQRAVIKELRTRTTILCLCSIYNNYPQLTDILTILLNKPMVAANY